MSQLVAIYDTTLRDGMQREELSLSVGAARRRPAPRRLRLRLHRGRLPGFSNPKYGELFRLLEREDLGASRLAAFGMTRRRGVTASEDPALRGLAESTAPVATIVGKTWDLHIEKVTRVSREENLRMIGESIAFLVSEGKEVVYDAEHFFDAYEAHPGYALDCLRAAEAGGAAWITPCDTNGATLPARCAEVMREVRRPSRRGARHPHPQRRRVRRRQQLAAVEQGAPDGPGTINGYGERCGNANLVSIIPSLSLKMGFRTVPPERLAELTALSVFVAETANLQPDAWAPYVGHNAFAHKGGMHQQGVNADARAYEHIDPATVGNERRVLVSELSGRGTILAKARELGVDLSDDAERVPAILARLKELEHEGYHFEVADGSFELLLERETGVYEPLFTLELPRHHREARRRRVETEATVKLFHRGERLVATAEGNGPVNALDAALRLALEPRVPELADLAGQLQGADPRRDQGHGGGDAGPHRLGRRPRRGARSA